MPSGIYKRTEEGKENIRRARLGKFKPIEPRFWSRVRKSAGCWEWLGGKHEHGYGVISFNGRLEKAHRVSWILHFGPIPKGKCVLHSCDNPPCPKPEHLFLGTKGDNTKDMVRKGRARGGHFQGDNHPSSRLTSFQVLSIRNFYKTSGLSMAALGKIYGVDPSHIHNIIHRKSWGHI